MRKFFLSIALAAMLVGVVGVSKADAQVLRGRRYYYDEPAYVYPNYSYYYSPDGAYYPAPDYYYPPAYYYPRYRRWWR